MELIIIKDDSTFINMWRLLHVVMCVISSYIYAHLAIFGMGNDQWYSCLDLFGNIERIKCPVMNSASQNLLFTSIELFLSYYDRNKFSNIFNNDHKSCKGCEIS